MMFKENLGKYRQQLEEKGYIHIKNVISDEFQKYIETFLHKASEGEAKECEQGYVQGKKRQFLFEFPSDEVADEFRTQIAALTGLDGSNITISERHLKQYDESAKEFPAPHKDRGASTYSVGLPIYLGPGTSVCLFPALDRSPNTGDAAIFLTEREHPGLEQIYQSDDVMFLREEVGDLIVFAGSALFHERSRPAGTAIVYIKLNDQGIDPLGEDIYGHTHAWTAASAAE